MYGVKITGVGCYVPDDVVTNEGVVKMLLGRRSVLEATGRLDPSDPRRIQFETDPEWIEQRTGIRERRFAKPEEATSDLVIPAAEKALAMAGLRRDAVNFIIVATVTPDHQASPPTASIVQERLGIPSSAALLAYDTSAACTSFVIALAQGYALIRSGVCRAGLVVGADVMTRIANPNDRRTFILFGDAAGCFVLERTAEAEDEFGPRNFLFGSDGSCRDLISIPAGGSRKAVSAAAVEDPFDQSHKLRMDGSAVFKTVVPLIKEIVPRAVANAGLTLRDIDLLLFHQANGRMVEPVEESLRRQGFCGLVYNNIASFANTTCGSLPLSYTQAVEQGLLRQGQRTLLVAFGGGLTWGTALVRSEL